MGQEKYTAKILIDGSQLSTDAKLLPYLRKMIGSDEESLHFNYIILTHYHNDHYNGLLGIKDGKITADSIVDPGGYRVSSIFNHPAPGVTNSGLNFLPEDLKSILAYCFLPVIIHLSVVFAKTMI